MKMPIEIPDSLSKLNEALEDCGVPQRDTKLGLEGSGDCDYEHWENAIVVHHWQKFDPTDRAACNEAWRTVIAVSAFEVFCYFDDFAYTPGKRVVWRCRPEVAEHEDGDWLAAGSFVKTGKLIAKFYCRFWIEDSVMEPTLG